MTAALTDADLALHKKIGIPPELLLQQQVRRVDDREARKLLSMNGRSGRLDGIVYPYLDPRSRTLKTCRVRRDHPEFENGKPTAKYLSAYGDRRHLYLACDVPTLLDAAVLVIFVEAEKSVLAITAAAARCQRPIVAIGLGGCWGWRGRIGKTTAADGARVDEMGVLPDFDKIPWAGRDVVIAFDANAAENAKVQAARRALARELTGRKTSVRILALPQEDGINGPDDYIGRHSDEAFFALVNAALPEDFKRNKKHNIITSSLDNIRLALSKLGVVLTYNAFTGVALAAGVPVDDALIDRLWIQIDDTFHWRPSKATLRTVVVTDARQAEFHPVRQYLDRLQWDGTPRVDTWLIKYGGAKDSKYVRAVGSLTLIAAVRRVRHPGCKFDEIPSFESPQGTGKSSAVRAICVCDEWFSDDLPLGVDSKQVIERTSGKWIIEASELHGNRGREAEQVKAFLSRQVDGPVRLAYGHLSTTVPRQFITVGSTNSRIGYLKDSTGARRFWPVKVGTFDIDALVRDRDQLWAEAAAREAKGESIRMSKDLWPAATEQQEARRAIDPWEPILEPLLEGDGGDVVSRVAVNTIWKALGVEACHQDNRHADRVAKILERHDFVRKEKLRLKEHENPIWFWLRDGD